MTAESSATSVLNLTGERIALGPQRRDLVTLTHRWLNDFAVMSPLGAPLRPLSDDGAAQVYEDSERAADQVWFTVYERTPLRPIGIAGLRDIDRLHRTAEFVIFIGEKDCWGKGYGTETARLLLDYGFSALGLHNIMLKVFAFNERSLRAYRRAGFREIGRRRCAFRLAGEVYDVIFMDCLATEFVSRALQGMLAGADDQAGRA
jgi:diamine N-acetyltransferase